MNKRKIMVMAMALCMVAILAIGGTLAYFTDDDQNTNVFTMGNVDIVLDEAKVIRGEGEAEDEYTAGKERVKENRYEEVYPGAVLPKDPTVHNVGTYPAYIRAKVTIDFNRLAALQADKELFNGENEDEDLTNIADIDTENWKYADRAIDFNARTVTYTYNYNAKLEAEKDTTPLFTQIIIPTFVTNEDVAAYGLQEFEMSIVAEAVQTYGFDSLDAAFAATFDAPALAE